MKKILTILLALFLLAGCGSKSSSSNNKYSEDSSNSETTEYSGEYFLNLLKNYEVREKSNKVSVENEEFNSYLDSIFDDLATSSYTFMHSSLKDYKSMDLTKPEVTWGELEYGVDQDEVDKTINQLNTLLEFDYDSLTYSQQYDFDLLHYSLLETLCGLYYDNYSLIFSDNSSVSNGVIEYLMEFNFYDEESVDDYITLLKDVERYLNQAIEYSKKQSEAGLYHTDDMLDNEKVYIDSVLDDDGKSLIVSFKTNSPYQDQYDEVEQLIKYDVIQAFSSLEDYIDTLYGKAETEDLALANIDKGYAEYTFIVNGSNNASIDDTFNALYDYYENNINDLISTLNSEDKNLYSNYLEYIDSDVEPFSLSAEDMLEYLRNNISDRYSYIDSKYTISSLTTLGSSTAGYYVSPPLDDLDQNTIRVNANMQSSGISNYEILAHEGFPGHLYQNMYFQKTNPHKFRSTQSFIGYSEGYADLAGMDALELIDWPNENYIKCAKFDSTTLSCHVLYSIFDIAINYYGYSLEQFKTLMENLSINTDYADFFYDCLVSMPGVYARYGVGFVSHYNLREKAKEALGDKFNYVSYSDAILKNGPLPFNILEGAVEEYIDANK